MKKLIFAYFSDCSDPKDLLLAASIRKFGGSLSDYPIWVLIPKREENVANEMKNLFLLLNVDLIPFSTEDELKFPFITYVLAAANAEALAKEKTELLAWLGSNTIIFNEPKHFLLDNDKNLGYRPVHHTNIGSFYDEPIDPFWDLVYQKCNISKEQIFPMKTHVDHNKLRPYFNAGCLIIRPEKGLLQSWWNTYKELHNEKCIKDYYNKNYIYAIFIHQVILSGVILSTMERSELFELPFDYNYPLNLYYNCPFVYRAKDVNKLITVRYEDLGDLKKILIQDPLKSWLISQIDNFFLKTLSSAEKIKFGNVPLVYPVPIILAGAFFNNKPNFETLGDVGIMGIKPPLVYISSGQDHYTNQGILEHGTFSINFPTTQLLTKTDYCGVVSGKDVDKSQLFNVFYGELETAPMIRECPVNLECKVIKEFSIQHRQIFIAEIVQAYVSEDYVIKNEEGLGIADMVKLDPIIYALDNNYYKIGESIGTGYQESQKFKQD
ncbi:MAG: flavin reductase family protein [Promethearchaeota archaeon]|nr:MAG: flavin reductase family protein [Candidatus Lokiarchaeota archaeon]